MPKNKKNFNTQVRKLAKQVDGKKMNKNKQRQDGEKAAKHIKKTTSTPFLNGRLTQKMKHWKGDQSQKLEETMANAQLRAKNYDLKQAELETEKKASENTNRDAENSRRQFYRELRRVIDASDVVVQVLDARDPENCRNKAIEREVVGESKKMVLLLNKVDLVPKEVALEWQKRMQEDFPCLLFKCGKSRGENMSGVKDATEELMNASSSVLGADNLVQLLKNYARTKAGSKKAIAVGIVGFPNVGKSSVINSLKRSTVVKAGGTAGVTQVSHFAVKSAS